MSQDPHDAGIPVLTQVVTPGRSAEPPPAMTTQSPMAPLAPLAPRPAAFTGPEEARDARRRLEQEISGRVLQQLMDRVDSTLEARLHDGLVDAVQMASERLVNDIRATLQETLEKVVTEAVAQELAKLRPEKSKNT